MKEHLEGALKPGGAPRGYVIVATGDGRSAVVRYPEEHAPERSARTGHDQAALTRHPRPKLSRCADILEAAGYHIEYVHEATAHALRVPAR